MGWKQDRDKKKQEKKTQDTQALELSLTTSGPQIELQYNVGLKPAGAGFARGDAIGQAEMMKVLKTLQESLLFLLKQDVQQSSALQLSHQDLMRWIADGARTDAVRALREQQQRFAPTAPLISQPQIMNDSAPSRSITRNDCKATLSYEFGDFYGSGKYKCNLCSFGISADDAAAVYYFRTDGRALSRNPISSAIQVHKRAKTLESAFRRARVKDTILHCPTCATSFSSVKAIKKHYDSVHCPDTRGAPGPCLIM